MHVVQLFVCLQNSEEKPGPVKCEIESGEDHSLFVEMLSTLKHPAGAPPTGSGHRSAPEPFSEFSERQIRFNDKQSQIAERKTGDGRGPGDHSSEAG